MRLQAAAAAVASRLHLHAVVTGAEGPPRLGRAEHRWRRPAGASSKASPSRRAAPSRGSAPTRWIIASGGATQTIALPRTGRAASAGAAPRHAGAVAGLRPRPPGPLHPSWAATPPTNVDAAQCNLAPGFPIRIRPSRPRPAHDTHPPPPGFARRAIASLPLTLATGLPAGTPQALAADNGSSERRARIAELRQCRDRRVIQAISKISGRNFIIDPRREGTSTSSPPARWPATSPTRSCSRRCACRAARRRGATGVTKIVPEADAKLHAVPVAGAGRRRRRPPDHPGLRLEARIRQPAGAGDPPAGVAQQHRHRLPGNNSLVVTDYAENVGRIAQIVESIDVPRGRHAGDPAARLGPRPGPDRHPPARRRLVAGTTAGVAGGGGDASQRISVIGDPRTNSLLVRSENPSKLNAVRQLVANLDKPGAAGNIHVGTSRTPKP